MDTSELIANIDDEIARLRQVRALLAGDSGRDRGRRSANRPRKRRKLSAEARAKIAAAQKKRWAKQKKQAASK